MKGIIGKKLGMAHTYDSDDNRIPVTVLKAGPCTVLQVRSQHKDGYNAVQLGFGQKKKKNTPQPELGHAANAGLQENPPAVMREIRADSPVEHGIGDQIKVDQFAVSEYVDVIGTTKGRGFQGVVRRWNFGGGRASHGFAWTRKPGSVGMCENPGRIYKGRKMPGHMGNRRSTVQNLQVVDVRPDDNIMLVKGSVPGSIGSVVIVKDACKKPSGALADE